MITTMTIEHDTRKPTFASLEADLARNLAEQASRQDRINSCEVEASDCCLSMWAAGATEGKKRCQMDLARNGWKWTFSVLARLDGTVVHGKTWRGKDKFSFKMVEKWIIDGEWMPSYDGPGFITPRCQKNLEKRGFKWITMEVDAHVAESFGSYVGAPVHAFPFPDDQTIFVRSAPEVAVPELASAEQVTDAMPF
jgi:hypothetical protein